MYAQPLTIAIHAFLALHCTTLPAAASDSKPNNRPIIGILTQEISTTMRNQLGTNEYSSYIAASYVKFIEGAGARVVPIWIGMTEAYYRDVLGKINGVLWPGGATSLNRNDGYADAGYEIYKIAEEMNQDGHYFPIFGICLGFELLTRAVAGRAETRKTCDSTSQTIPLTFTSGYRTSRLFNDISDDVDEILSTKEVTANFHRYCVTKNTLKRAGVSKKFRILSLNNDLNGVQFVSSLEHVALPFYGLQFHPEKNLYEWILGKRIPHGTNAIKAAQYFANFFVNEARKSKHKFSSEEEERGSLIYNYQPRYTALNQSLFVQCYLF